MPGEPSWEESDGTRLRQRFGLVFGVVFDELLCWLCFIFVFPMGFLMICFGLLIFSFLLFGFGFGLVWIVWLGCFCAKSVLLAFKLILANSAQLAFEQKHDAFKAKEGHEIVQVFFEKHHLNWTLDQTGAVKSPQKWPKSLPAPSYT